MNTSGITQDSCSSDNPISPVCGRTIWGVGLFLRFGGVVIVGDGVSVSLGCVLVIVGVFSCGVLVRRSMLLSVAVGVEVVSGGAVLVWVVVGLSVAV